MPSKSLGKPVLYALIAVGVYLAYLVLSPFVGALTWAVIFAILFRRLQVALMPRLGPNGAAAVTTVAVAVAIVAPAVVLISSLAREAPRVTESLTQASQNAPRQIQRIWDAARARSPVPLPENAPDLASGAAQRALTFVSTHASDLVANVFALLGNVGAMLFALFFMLRDGAAMSRGLRDRLPFPEEDSERLMSDTRDMVMASVGAGVAVAAAQGVVGGVAFWLVGIGAPAFWGVIIGFASLLPVVGATSVWVPAAIGLLLSGDIGQGVLLFLLGIFGISMVDNVLRPLLLTGKTSMSGLVVFFGLLGGAAAFGFIGLVIGPIILVITARLLESLPRPNRSDESAPARNLTVAAGG
jgi:predicted PurR-regulated permease PerM